VAEPRTILKIDRLSHSYGQRRALDGLTLAVAAGEIFALLGPNGSGKTTLFRVLSTLIPPQEGSVTLDFGGATMTLPADRDRVRGQISVLFQAPSLDKQLTAEENLRHHGHLYGLRGAELTRRIDDVLARFGLADRRKDYVLTLSGGMKRRVELAKALLTRPRLLLLDEPSTGLDPAARLDLFVALEEARRSDGVTVLLTTHLMDEADKADRLAILDQGKLIAVDTPAALKARVGGDVLTLNSPDPQALQAALREKLSLEAERLNGTLRLELPRAHERIPQIVETLPGLIDSVSVGKPTLEDVFIHLTGHRLREREGLA
jgi:ABC-2 type transport system ATP-binding protein